MAGVGVCLHLTRLERDPYRCSCHRAAKFIITHAIYAALPANQTRQPRAPAKHYPSSIVLSSIAKRLTTVYLPDGRRRSGLLFFFSTIMQVFPLTALQGLKVARAGGGRRGGGRLAATVRRVRLSAIRK